MGDLALILRRKLAWFVIALLMTVAGTGASAQALLAPAEPCPANFVGQGTTDVLDCTCPLSGGSGSVWGTATYTSDSAICAAAMHAGAISNPDMLTFGTVTVTVAGTKGCDAYVGTSRNGVTTHNFQAWNASFYFPAVSEPSCAQTFESVPPPPVQRNYSIHFVGLQCVRRAQPFLFETSDAVLAITFVVEEDGTIRESHTLPRENGYYEGLAAGGFRQADVVVWEGLTQTIDLNALLYKYDPVLPNILGGLIRATSAVGGALVAIGTGGTGAAAGAAAALAGDMAASEVQDRMSEVATPLGHKAIYVDLALVGDPASQPLQQAGPIRYHFSTTHTERGGHYELYWVIR